MRVTNDDDGDAGRRHELARLRAAGGPAAPGTVVVADPAVSLRAAGEPGGTADLALEIADTQQRHCTVIPALSPFVHASGTTWFPAAAPEPGTVLVGPGDSAELRVRVSLPAQLPPGEWRGCLLLHGFRGTGIAVTITVAAAADREVGRAGDRAQRPRHGASRGPVRPRVPHPTPARGRSRQVVLPAVPPDLAARLEET